MEHSALIILQLVIQNNLFIFYRVEIFKVLKPSADLFHVNKHLMS